MRQRVFATALLAALVSACGGDAGITEPSVLQQPKVLNAVGVDPNTGATIETNQDDYAPGEIVHVSGRGWAPNETVSLFMSEDPNTHPDVAQDVQADSTGAFALHFYDVVEHDLGVLFTLTATGRASGSVAVATFTDGTIGSASIELRDAATCATPTASVVTGTPICAHASFNIAPGGATNAQFRWKSPAGVIVNISQRAPQFTASETGARTFAASYTPTTAGTWTVLLCQSADVNPAPGGIAQCASSSQKASQTFEVTAAPTNSAPVLATIGDKNVDELTQLAFTATANDDGKPNPPAALSYSLDVPATGTFPAGAVISVGGNFTWTPNESQGPGTYRVKVIVSDGALSDEEEIEISVAEVQSNPVLTAIGNQVVDELTQLSFTASATDPDGGTLSFSLANPATGDFPGGAAITTGGAFTWTPNESQGPGVYRVKVVVEDPDNNKAEEEFQITVNEVNLPPVLAAIGNKNVNELVQLSFNASASDADLPANTLSFSLDNPATGNYPTGATISSGGAFAWTPSEEQGPGTYRVKVVVDDGKGATDDEEIEITVAEVNVAPVLTVPADVFTQWGVALGNLSATATDADIPVNALTFSKVSGPTWVTVAADGTISFASIGAANIGTHTVRVRVQDNGSPIMGDEEEFDITVQDRPTQLTYDGTTSGQYSDESTLRATLVDNGVGDMNGDALAGKTIDFYFNGVKVGSGTTDADGKAAYDYAIRHAASTYQVQAKYAGGDGYAASSSTSTSFAVNRENAEGLTIANPGAAQVGVTSFTVTVGVKEARKSDGDEPNPNDGQLAGSIANVPSITAVASPVSGSGNIGGTCSAGSVSGSGYGAVKSFTCVFDNGTAIPVDVYTLTFTVGGDYYTGTYEEVFSIWDPAAGFATGGGSFMIGSERVSFGFSFTMTKGKTTPRGGLVVVRHLQGGGVCRVKSNSMNAPSVTANVATLGGKGNYNCVVNGITTISQGNINVIAVAEDWATSGADADKFRVKAMDELDMSSTVVLAGGNIQVPQPQR